MIHDRSPESSNRLISLTYEKKDNGFVEIQCLLTIVTFTKDKYRYFS